MPLGGDVSLGCAATKLERRKSQHATSNGLPAKFCPLAALNNHKEIFSDPSPRKPTTLFFGHLTPGGRAWADHPFAAPLGGNGTDIFGTRPHSRVPFPFSHPSLAKPNSSVLTHSSLGTPSQLLGCDLWGSLQKSASILLPLCFEKPGAPRGRSTRDTAHQPARPDRGRDPAVRGACTLNAGSGDHFHQKC